MKEVGDFGTAFASLWPVLQLPAMALTLRLASGSHAVRKCSHDYPVLALGKRKFKSQVLPLLPSFLFCFQ